MQSKINNIFLKDSNVEAFEYYNELLRNSELNFWDIVVITASNIEQAKTYELQIDFRLKNNLLPKNTQYIVLPDIEGKRIGSGGATFNVLRHIVEIYNDINIFKKKKVLIIHSGGDSKRIPQYSSCGKLFSPTPREINNNRSSTLFDELIISLSMIPSRMPSGILLLSGDALLLFNSLQIDLQYKKIAALTIKAEVEQGTHHGVFLSDENKDVKLFLHKASIEELINKGASQNGYVDIDTGAIFMDSDVIVSLLSLITTKSKIDLNKFNSFVSEDVQLNFYGDILYPMTLESTLDDYLLEKAEKKLDEKIIECRKKIWECLHQYKIKLIKLFPGKFIHFGTTLELLELMNKSEKEYTFIDWQKNSFSINESKSEVALVNSIIDKSVVIKENSYVEYSHLKGKTKLGKNVIVSNTTLEDVSIPNNTCISTLKLKDGSYVTRIYSIYDNPKEILEDNASFLNNKFSKFIKYYNIDLDNIWDKEEKSMWYARLYSSSSSMKESVNNALLLYKIISCKATTKEVASWLKSNRHSLYSSFNNCNTNEMLQETNKLEKEIRIRKILNVLENKEEVNLALNLFKNSIDKEDIVKYFLENINNYSYSIKMRLYYLISLLWNDLKLDHPINKDSLFNEIFNSIREFTNCSFELEKTPKKFKSNNKVNEVALPVRVNFSGGWSDTPPYCLENGGTVLNMALYLQNTLPIKACSKKIKDSVIVFESVDYGTKIEIKDIKDILNYNNPYDPFALHKAAILVSGIIPFDEKLNLEEYLKNIGGGIHLTTDVSFIPRGSGLGTSSILIGAALESLHKLMNESISKNELCREVLVVEQLMSTGGGWQDQVGGIVSGIKLITTSPGASQRFNIKKLRLSDKTKKELDERLVLIYTGQRRLARNLLRNIVLKYISGEKEVLDILYQTQRLAVLMSYELEHGNLDELGNLMNRQWNYNITLDKGATNSCIEQIINVASDLICGKIIVGAGGGGFIAVLLKKGISKEQLKERLQEGFQDSGVLVYDSKVFY